jgi:hypothetical protein
MKKIIALTVIVLFALGTVAAFAGQSSGSISKGDGKSLFQIVADTMKGKCQPKPKNRLIPIMGKPGFQSTYNDVDKISSKCLTERPKSSTK